MIIYYVEHENEKELILKKEEINEENMIYDVRNDKYILKKCQIVKEKDIDNYNFKKSKIYTIKINQKKYEIKKYNKILKKIYEIIDEPIKIIKSSILNIKIGKKDDKGYNYIDRLGISYQSADSNKCIKEILKQCNENNIKIKIDINDANNNNFKILSN